MDLSQILVLATAISIMLSIVGWLMHRHLQGIVPSALLDILPLGGHEVAQLGILFFAILSVVEIRQMIVGG